MGVKRSLRDLVIEQGPFLRLEWYWRADGTMPGHDEYDDLSTREREEFIVAVTHWLNRKPGERPLQSVINKEWEKPLIVAIKAGSRRFPTFEGIPGSSWVVMASYRKKGQKRDQAGDRAIQRALTARQDYIARVKAKAYYKRDSGA
jgi:hypothetical protein